MNKLVQTIQEKGGKIALENWRKENPGKNPDLSGADLNNTDLQEADLSNTIFKYTNLQNANLTKANLRNCKFFKADLSGANCTNADFTGAKLTDTNVKYTIFKNAHLSDTNVMSAYIKEYAICAKAKFNDEHQLTQVLVMIMSSCFTHRPGPEMHILVSCNHYSKPEEKRYEPKNKTTGWTNTIKKLFGK